MLTSAILTLATATSAPHARFYERQARQYFDVWNTHDVTRLRPLLADGVTLRDWDIQASGADAVASANGIGVAAVHEWYAHFPYETARSDLYSMVATEQAPVRSGGGFGRYLYSTQLRQMFHKIFERQPRYLLQLGSRT